MTGKTLAYCSLGSNTADSVDMLGRAVSGLAAIKGVGISCISPVFMTEPQDYPTQPWFANMAASLVVDAAMEPEECLEAMLALETRLGRKRDPAIRYGPRSIDIDLLLFGTVHSSSSACALPHPRMLRRAFVLVPLLCLNPWLEIDGKPLKAWLAQLAWQMDGWKIFQSP